MLGEQCFFVFSCSLDLRSLAASSSVMELVNGGSLDSFLRKHGAPMPIIDKAYMCLDVARGLEYLHDRGRRASRRVRVVQFVVNCFVKCLGCIHRDVAARNCLVDASRVKVGQ